MFFRLQLIKNTNQSVWMDIFELYFYFAVDVFFNSVGISTLVAPPTDAGLPCKRSGAFRWLEAVLF